MKKRIISLLLVLSMLLCVVPAVSAVDPAPNFTTRSLTLNKSIAINFKVPYAAVEGIFEKVVFTKGGDSWTIETLPAADAQGMAVFTFKHLSPRELGTTVKATLVTTKGEAYRETSVLAYCNSVLNNDSASGNLKKLIVDLLNYGAAFQTFKNDTTELVNSGTGAYAHLGTAATPSIGNKKVVGDETGKAVKWHQATLRLNDSVEIIYQVKNAEGSEYAAGDLKLKVEGYGEYPFEKLQDGTFQAVFDKLNPAQMREVVKAVVVADGQEVSSTVDYSIESYAYWAVNEYTGEDAEALEALAIAMIKYGDSAAAYVKEPNSEPEDTTEYTVKETFDYADDTNSSVVFQHGKNGWYFTQNIDATNLAFEDSRLKIQYKTGGSTTLLSKSFTAITSGKAVVEFDFETDFANATDISKCQFIFRMSGGGTDAYPFGVIGNAVKIPNDGENLIDILPSGVHHAKIVVDIVNGNYDVYIDDTLVREDAEIAISKGLSTIRFGVYHSDKTESVAAYIDNVKVYAVNE